jgi:hypothetical protein
VGAGFYDEDFLMEENKPSSNPREQVPKVGIKAVMLVAYLYAAGEIDEKIFYTEVTGESSTNAVESLLDLVAASGFSADGQKIQGVIYEKKEDEEVLLVKIDFPSTQISVEVTPKNATTFDWDRAYAEIVEEYSSHVAKPVSKEEALAQLPGCSIYIAMNYFTA